MKPAAHEDVTELLLAWSGGDRNALDRLLPLVYAELQRLASRHLRRERPDHTLQTTALVHEAFLRLVDQRQTTWLNRAQFLSVAAQMMRWILVDHARGRDAVKRGGEAIRVELDAALQLAPVRSRELLAVDSALQHLAEIDPRQARVVELRYFGGLTVEETAAALGISPATVKREWTMAKAWLYQELAGDG